MKKLALILMAAITCVACTKKSDNQSALEKAPAEQTTISNDTIEQIYMVVEQMPEFPGGMGKLMTYLGENIKYPSKALELQWEGRAICQFVVEKDGSITNAEIVKSSGYQLLDVEAMRVVLNMPNWSAGIQNGDSVRVKFTIPVTFKLRESDKKPVVKI
ncbi:MAG: energy transducer TonB [Paludibacteraceae bacterium]|nr:energy transducer TonB [Paludibacteraceae bacterium]